MTPFRLFLIIFCVVLNHRSALYAQGVGRANSPLSSSAESKQQVKSAEESLKVAQKTGELEQAKSVAKELIQKLPSSVTEAAKIATDSPQGRAQVFEAAKSAASSVMPQMQKGLAPSIDVRASTTNTTNLAGSLRQSAPQGPVPGTLPHLENLSQLSRDTPMGVIDAERTDFDLKKGIFLYSGKVRARHPDFYIECEELEIYMMKKGAEEKRSRTSTVNANKEDDKAPPIQKAIARGSMVVIEKRDPKGDVQQGRCKRLDYNGLTGEITLSDFPQVQKGNVMHVATTSDTIMVFDKSGKLSTNRPSRTVILSGDQAKSQGER